MNFDFLKPKRGNTRLESALAEIEREDFVSRLLESDDAYIFKHVLIQETAYASLLRNERRALHLRIANSCEFLYADEIDENLALLAFHFEQAGETDQAVNYWMRYGERAMQISAYPEAIEALRRALKLAPHESNASSAQIYAQLGEIYSRQTDFALSKENFQNALNCAIAANDGVTAARALTGIARVESQQGNHKRARELGEEALRWANDAQDVKVIARAHRQLGIAYSYEGNYALGQEHLQTALALYRELGNLEGIGSCLNSLGVIARDLGELDCAEEYFSQALELGRQLGDRYSTSIRLLNLGALAEARGELARAEQYQKEALELAQQIGDREGIAVVRCNLGMLALRRRNLENAMTEFRGALDQASSIGAHATAVYVIAAVAKLELARGNYEYAAELLEFVLAHPAVTADIPIDFAPEQLALREKLGASDLNAARERGRARELHFVVKQILAESKFSSAEND